MAIENIIASCDAKDIKYENHADRGLLTVQLPKARSFTNVLVTAELAELAIEREIDFLSYKLIDGYEAVWSPTYDVVECEVELPHRSFSFERIFRDNQELTEDGKLLIDTHVAEVKVELSAVSDEFNFIDLYKDTGRPRSPMRVYRFERRKNVTSSLKITGLNVTNHDQALNIIKTIFASICFQIDCKTNMPLMLATERNFSRISVLNNSTDDLQLTAVTQKYDSEAQIGRASCRERV